MIETEELRLIPRFVHHRSRRIVGKESDFLGRTKRSVLDIKFQMSIRYLRKRSE